MRTGSRAWLAWAGFLAGFAALYLLLAMPANPTAIRPASFLRPPIELAFVIAALAFTPERWRKPVRRLLAVAAVILLLLRVGDAGFYLAFDRPFDPVVDLALLPAGWTLLSGAVGTLRALAAVAAALAAIAVLTATLSWSLRGIQAVRGLRGGPVAASVVALIVAGLSLALTGPSPGRPRTAAPGARLLASHASASAHSLADATVFPRELASDPYGEIPDGTMLAALRGKDVLIVFVESYGRSAIEDARYAPVVGRRLSAVDRELARSGFQARSGWLTSSTFGGQSWLAHETLLSGLWIDGGRRYDQLVKSHRATLISDFGRAGWRTVAVMPAIAEPWPEGGFFGYDRIYASKDLGYRGLPFNWITMPDQFTLAALRRLELERKDRPPVLAEIALISSHAPFVPTPPLLDWTAVGDGKVYDAVVQGSEPPESVWRDMKRVGAKYADAIDYSLASLAAFARDYGDDRLVMIVLGDHQPGGVITAKDASHDVPMHVIAKDPQVLAAFEAWGWKPGMRPAERLAAMGMDRFRGRLIESFTPVGR